MMIKKITKQDKDLAISFDYTEKQYSNCSIAAYINDNKCHIIYQFEGRYTKQEGVSINSAFSKMHHYGPEDIRRYIEMAE